MTYTERTISIAFAAIAMTAGTGAAALGAAHDDSSTRWLYDSVPAAWEWTPEATQPTPEKDMWWRQFGDETLVTLLRRAVEHNYNARTALRRIDMARQVERQTKAGYSPTFNAVAGWQGAQDAGAAVGDHDHSERSRFFSLGVEMNWEIDVFGRVRAQLKADKASERASVADYDAVLVSLGADVAKAYFQLRLAQGEMSLAESSIKTQNELLDLANTRYETGLVPSVDVFQARMNVANTQSQLPAYRQAVTEALNELSILTGDYPDKLSQLLAQGKLPEAPLTPADITPGSLLSRRPDIIAAQAQIAYQAALVGVAKKDFLPTLAIDARVATESREFKGLFGAQSIAYSVQPTLTWSIFEGLARNARVAEAKLNLEEMIDNYNLTVMTAMQEVNNALAAYQSVADRVGLEEQCLKYSEKLFELQLDRYKQGLIDFSDVADAQADVIDTQNSLLEIRAQKLDALVTLYAALGGGW